MHTLSHGLTAVAAFLLCTAYTNVHMGQELDPFIHRLQRSGSRLRATDDELSECYICVSNEQVRVPLVIGKSYSASVCAV